MSRGTTLTVSTELVTEECCNCGITFAMPREMRDRLKGLTTRGEFYCPSGHPQHYTGESDEAKIRRLTREADAARQEAAAEAESARYAWKQADEAEKTAKALRKAKNLADRRASAAMCPVPGCHRQIQQMNRHLHTKHPQWVHEQEQHGNDTPGPKDQ